MRRPAAAAVLLVAALAGAAAVVCAPRGAVAQEQYTEFAQRRFLRGRELFEAGQYEGALAEFRASLALYNSPNARLFAARCLRELGRLPEAAAEFERTLLEATDRAARDERYAPTRDTAREELAALEPRIARVTVRAPPAAPPGGLALTIGGREVPPAALGMPVTVLPGLVEITARAPGYDAARAAVDVAPGQRITVDLPALRPRRAVPRPRARLVPRPAAFAPRDARPALRAGGYVAGGVGLAGLASFAVFGGLTLRENAMCSAATMECPDANVIATGEALQTTANVSLAVGIAGVVAGAVLLLVAATTRPPRAAPPPLASRAARPSGARPRAVALDQPGAWP